MKKLYRGITMLIITTILTFFFHVFLSITKYFHTISYAHILFENFLIEMTIIKFLTSLFLAGLTASFVYFFIKNREINKLKQDYRKNYDYV